MPIYEYECSRCGHIAEVWQKFSDPPVAECQLCKGRMRKLISQSSFHLKGTGWYVTDYANKSGVSEPRKGKPEDKTSSTAEKKSGESSNKKDPSANP